MQGYTNGPRWIPVQFSASRRISAAAVGHALENVSESLAAFHEKVRKKISRSKKGNFDETGMQVSGRKGWIWITATERYAYVQVAMSRGRDVLEKYFPKFRGVAIVDGWKSYEYFLLIQKCWARMNKVTLVPTATNASWMNPVECHTGDIQKLALDGTNYRNWNDVGKSFRDTVSYRNVERKARGKRFRDTQMRRDGRRKLKLPLWKRH